MKKPFSFLLFALTCLSISAQETMIYRLEPVTKITAGQKYVFVQNGRAIINTITSGALQTTDNFATTNLTGSENYVWNVSQAVVYPTAAYFITDNSSRYLSQVNANSNNLTFDADATSWQFTSAANDKMVITTVSNKITYTLGLKSSTATEYKLYQNVTDGSPYPHFISVYQLIPTSYARPLSGDNIGTICLPYQVDKHTGADIYQIAYKETDQLGNPTRIYYELISGPMLAGHPYVFVPTADQVVFPATEVRVTQPVSDNGFYGTFKNIEDQATHSDKNTLENNYMINANSQFQLCGSGCSLRAYRAYLKMDEVPLSNQVSAPTRQVMAIGQNSSPQFYQPSELPTALFHATATPRVNKFIENGHLHILHNGVRYTLLGQTL